MKEGLRSYVIGMHNPMLHGTLVTLAWIRLYHKLPSLREFICILFHDIGYVKQDSFDDKEDCHPIFGAQLCGALFGKKYYNLCIAHSRQYAEKLDLKLSKLAYADKYSLLLYPNWLFQRLVYVGGEAQQYHRTTKTRKWGFPLQVELIKADYNKWMKENRHSINVAKKNN